MTDFLKLSQEAYDGSTSYMDANWRPDIDYSLRAFRNEHAASSKYNSPEFAHRSRLFRPKTRAIIRKTEAAGAAALFSNPEVITITPENPDDVMNKAGADALKHVLEYRLEHSIKTFPLVMGALQDAQKTGAVVSYQYWEYEKGKKDKPCVELRPIENIRLDPNASWLDPINTSPYLCDIIPMHVCDVKAMMKKKDSKTGEPAWKKLDDKVIEKARPDVVDSTRRARLGKQQDPQNDSPTGIGSFDVVWVMRWFMKDEDGEDHTYYTLGTEELLTDPKPIKEVYFHGKRPYVMGYAILESHQTLKSSIATLIKPLQQEANDIANQRLDNVKFVLNKRWIVARGRQVDVNSLVRNTPGGVTLVTDPKTDVQESNWPDVTSSAYVEHDRINAEIDDVAGNFSPSTKVANNAVNDTLGGSKMASMGAGLMTDYLLLTFIQTWWEEVLKQLVLLEQEYETDEVILAAGARGAQLWKKYNYTNVTDEMLAQPVNVRVNVGMGASNPNERFAKLIMGTGQVMQVIATAPPNFNVNEFIKEAYSHMGYRDGSRFWSDQADPRLMKAMQLIQQLQGALQGKQMEIQAKTQVEAAKIQSHEKLKGAELQIDAQRIAGDLRIRESENAIEAARVQLEQMIAQMDAQGASQEQKAAYMQTLAKLKESELKLQGQRLKNEGARIKLLTELNRPEREAA